MISLITTLFLLGCDTSISEYVAESPPQVSTPLGIIEGIYDTSGAGRLYEAYKGIPFAHPPTGNSRFGIAKSVSPWSGVLMAKQFGPVCMQYRFTQRDPNQAVQGSEDCLRLNIYTPSSYGENGRRSKLLPVIFYIPGGAFQMGNGNKMGPKYLLDKDVTLVTINYRVGPLGFLNTEDGTVSGNMGLKDQVIAMRWVKDNIRFFGGDPSNINIFGQSAGSVSVHYHYLTKLTEGLFRGGMSLSGTSLNCWSLTRNPLAKAKRLATAVGCPTDNTTSMVDCLRSRPAEHIVQAVGVFQNLAYNPSNAFGPSIEKVGSEFTFIDRSPEDIITSGDAQDVPWITGIVSEEGLFPAAFYIADQDIFEELEDDWVRMAPYLLVFNDTIQNEDKPRVARLIKEHYLGQSSFNGSTFDKIVQMIGDRLFASAVEEAAKSQARSNKSPVYVYYFSYRGAHSLTKTLSGTSETFGTCHGDDQAYILDVTELDPTTTARDRDMQKVLINLWVSFAADGKPDVGIEWPSLNQSTEEEFQFLHIAGPCEIDMKSSSNFANKEFWRSIDFE